MANENERVVSEFCKTWETLNIDKVMEFFTDDAVYHNIPLAAAKGKAAIRKTIDGFMPGTTKIEFKILSTASAGGGSMSRVLTWGAWRGRRGVASRGESG